MAVAVASATNAEKQRIYQVIGVDRSTVDGIARVAAINQGDFPFPTSDRKLKSALIAASAAGNLRATTDESVYESADIVVIDIPLDIPFLTNEPQLDMTEFEDAVRTVFSKVPSGALVLVETTVPPGTCEKIVTPILHSELRRRDMDENSVHLAHSFERVMPGDAYLDSIVNFWRVYAGNTTMAADACEAFLTTIIDVKKFPLSRLSSMTASETTKVMENTYRAVNIAFVDEWTRYAEAVGVDLFEIIDAIQVRPTHSNIRFPGLGVGGYCLTKDPAFAPAAARQLHGLTTLDFPFSSLAIKVNHDMPLHAVARLSILLEGGLKDKAVLVLGLSYRQDIGDTRHSPAETLVHALESQGARVEGYDPLIDYWQEMNWVLPDVFPDPAGFDAVIFSTPHKEFKSLDVARWLGDARPVLLDASNVLSVEKRNSCRKMGVRVESVGRGDGL